MKRSRFTTLLALLLSALLLTTLAGCGNAPVENPKNSAEPVSPVTEAPTPTPTQAPTELPTDSDGAVRVSSVGELLEAIEPNATIIISPGRYNLTEFLQDYPNARDRDAWDEEHPYVWLDEVYDGVEITIRNVDGLSIRGGTDDPADTELVTDPRYAAVLNIDNCREPRLSGMTMGHTERGDCSGNVLNFNECSDVRLENLDLYGCGVCGVGAVGCTNLYVSDCVIRDCEFGPFEFYENSGEILFSDCVLSGSDGGGYYGGYEATSCLTFLRCTFGEEESDMWYLREDADKEECTWSEDWYLDPPDIWDTVAALRSDLDYERMELLFLYKDVQNGFDSVEELPTALTEQGWPDGAVKDEVRYLLYDIDGSGPAELIFTYFGDIIDIYGSNSQALRYAYGCPYRALATLHADGMLEENMGLAADRGVTTWYRFNTELGIYFPVLQMTYRAEKDKAEDVHYYRLAYETRSEEAVQYYDLAEEYPSWIWDRAEEITAEEYERLCSHSDPVTLPEGSRLSEFEGLGNLRVLMPDGPLVKPAEEQLDVFLAQQDVWYQGISPAYYPAYLYYAVTDLNQNGRLEIISTEYRYDCDVSINRFFELDETCANVVELNYDMADAAETEIAPGLLNADLPLLCFAKDGCYYYTVPTPYRLRSEDHVIQIEMMYSLGLDQSGNVTTELLGEAWTDYDEDKVSYMDASAAAIDEASYYLADYLRYPVEEGYSLCECYMLWVIPLGDSFREDLLDSWRYFAFERS